MWWNASHYCKNSASITMCACQSYLHKLNSQSKAQNSFANSHSLLSNAKFKRSFCCRWSPVWTFLLFKCQSLDCIFQVNWKWKLATNSKLVFPQGWAISATLKGTINLKSQLKLANETVYTNVHWFLDFKWCILASICSILWGFISWKAVSHSLNWCMLKVLGQPQGILQL